VRRPVEEKVNFNVGFVIWENAQIQNLRVWDIKVKLVHAIIVSLRHKREDESVSSDL
jgi:hypothetical protein